MHAWGKAVLACAILALGVTAVWETKLEQDKSNEWSAKAKQVQPFYFWSTLTHDGIDIGSSRGPLKLALHPFAGYTNFPNQASEHFTIDGMGLRGTGKREKSTVRKKLLLLGGSTAFGTGLNGDEETIGRFLEEFLDVDVLNAAVIGHSSGQELAYLVTDLVDLKPDVVLTIDGFNDFYFYWAENVIDRRALSVSGFVQLEQQLAVLKQLNEAPFLARLSNFFRLLYPRITERIGQSRISGWFDSADRPDRERQKRLSEPAETYAKNTIKMNQMGATFGYNFLCAFQPLKKPNADYRSFLQIAREALAAHHVHHVDLNELTGWKDEMFMDNVHTDRAGNRLIAGRIAEEIKKKRLL